MVSSEADSDYGVDGSGAEGHVLVRQGYISPDSRRTFIYSGTNNP